MCVIALSFSLSSPNTLLSFPSAIIEHVRDGSVVRALLLPDYYLVTVMLSGVKVITTQLLLTQILLNMKYYSEPTVTGGHKNK